MADLVAFETANSVLVYHVWSDIKLNSEHDMSNKPSHRGGTTTDILRKLPRSVTGTIVCADELMVPSIDSPEGNIQTKSRKEQLEAIQALQGEEVTVTGRNLPETGINGIMRMVNVEDSGQYDNTVVVSFEVREVDKAEFDFDDVEGGFIEVPFSIPDDGAPGAGPTPEQFSAATVVPFGPVSTGQLKSNLTKTLFGPKGPIPFFGRFAAPIPGADESWLVANYRLVNPSNIYSWRVPPEITAEGSDFTLHGNMAGSRFTLEFTFNNKFGYSVTILKKGSTFASLPLKSFFGGTFGHRLVDFSDSPQEQVAIMFALETTNPLAGTIIPAEELGAQEQLDRILSGSALPTNTVVEPKAGFITVYFVTGESSPFFPGVS